MRSFTDFLITFHIVKGLCGRGPALVGVLLAFSIPVGVLLVLIGEAHPGGLTSFAEGGAGRLARIPLTRTCVFPPEAHCRCSSAQHVAAR